MRFIANGGMGDVYEVHDCELRMRVALKTLRTEQAGDATIERFRRELYLARQVTHPNVCRLYDLGRHGDKLFLTMELLAGETLAQRLARSGRLSTTDALPLIRHVASAIDAAHAAGVVHRDLKPGNIMIDGLRAIVTDFGIAHATEDPFHQVSRTGDVVGSPDYMAPEQIAGAAITPAADIFALGIVLYEMVTGTRPFRGTGTRTELVPPRIHVPALDPRWNATILRCLAPASGERFASAAEVVAALDANLPLRARRGLRFAAACFALVVAGGAAWHVVTGTRTATATRPGADVEVLLRQATAQVEDSRGTEALATIAELRLQPAAANDPRVDLAEAAAAEAVGDFVRQQAAAARAEEAGTPEVVARARLSLARALSYQGKPEQAIAKAREAASMFEAAGDKDQEGRALAVEAFALTMRGDVDEAERIEERVLAMRRATGDHKNIARNLINLALLVGNRGQLERAQQLALEARDEAAASGDRRIEALALIRLAGIANAVGDPATAIARADEALAVRAPDDLRNYYFALECRAAAEAAMGRLDAAREHVQQALAVARRAGALDDTADDLAFLAWIAIEADDPAGAHRALDDAASSAADHIPESVAWRLSVTARLALAEGHPEQATQDARGAFDRFVQLGLAFEALEPGKTLARSLAARGDLAGARDALDRIEALHLEGKLARLTITLLRAQLGGDRPGLDTVRAEAADAHLALIERDVTRR